MKLIVIAIGRMKSGPERDLAERYRTRIMGAVTVTFGKFTLGSVLQAANRDDSEMHRAIRRGRIQTAGFAARAGFHIFSRP